MRLAREFVFFAYLLESYAAFKDTDAGSVLALLDERGLTDYVYDMYELYHSEHIGNAFADLDSLIETGKPAW